LVRLFFLVFLLLIINQSYSQNRENLSKTDSVYLLRSLARDNDYSLQERFKFAQRSSILAKNTKIDSTILNSNRILSFLYFQTDNDSLYIKTNHSNIKLASKINDSSALEVANFNLGSFYHINKQNDSAFFYYSKALKLYDISNDIESKSQVLSYIADIQEIEKDYLGSEQNAFEAIRLLKSLPVTEDRLYYLWNLNNLIGIISFKLKSYDRALEYHQKALVFSDKMKNGYYKHLYSINNMAITNRMMGNIDKSIELYNNVIEDEDLDKDDPSFYAIALANLAYSKSLKKERNINEIKKIFREAKRVSDTIEDPIAKIGVAIDFSKFLLDIKERDSALFYANRSYKISSEISNNELRLESLLILSKLKEGEEAIKYLNEHIMLSDSLLYIERNVTDKFARIEYETDELEAENERISLQKMWLSIVSGVLLLTLFLLYIIITQRAKNKELKFAQNQQKANEEIYNLMLSQQDKVDEARANEQKRISQEMHDGVLGRLFGTRLSLDSLNFSEGKEAILSRANYINELQAIEQDIRKISHDLNTDFVSGSGFTDILAELIEKQTQAYKLSYDFNHTDNINWESISNKMKINIYRITQESLQNIYKHAQASHVKISISLKNDVIWVSISDDGVGFDMNKSKKGIGLKNINSRIQELDGNVTFNSKIGEGTTVEINLPFQN
jgi:signal transduction histidine kinase